MLRTGLLDPGCVGGSGRRRSGHVVESPLRRLKPLDSEGKVGGGGDISGVQRSGFQDEDGLLGLGNVAML